MNLLLILQPKYSMLKFISIIFLLVSFQTINSQETYSELLNQLQHAIDQSPQRIKAKEIRIDSLKNLAKTQVNTPVQLLNTYLELSEENRLFNYSNAFHFYQKALNVAYQLGKYSSVAKIKIDFGDLITSIGLYAQAIDTLKSIPIALLSDADKINYYGTLVRTHFDWADFQSDAYYANKNRQLARHYAAEAQIITNNNSLKLTGIKAIELLARGQMDSALIHYQSMLTNPIAGVHDSAVANSCIGFIYSAKGLPDKNNYLIKSVLNDYKLINREGISLIVLADELYKQGELDLAYKFIKEAKANADLFGSKLRMVHASNVFSRIEAAVREKEMNLRNSLMNYILAGAALIIAAIVLMIILYRQFFNLKKIQTIINDKNNELTGVNKKLSEVNKIKDQYLTQFFKTNSAYIDKLVNLSNSIQHLIISKKVNKVQDVLKQIKPKEERDAFLHQFDELFLSLFPNFIQQVHKLLKPDEELSVKPGQLLSTELRLLALFRLGLTDNEEIIKILNISINTLYAYKNKIKKKSHLSGNDFDTELMKISFA